jgi:hypothetical protein
MIPLRHRRQSTGLRPVGLRGQYSRSSGSMIAHKLSSTSQIVSSVSGCDGIPHLLVRVEEKIQNDLTSTQYQF